MDVNEIDESLLRRYAEVAHSPAGQFTYPVGRESVERLGYRLDFVGRIPEEVVDRFVGVGNPFSVGEPHEGWRVVDVGCGAGFDCQIAAQHVGPTGQVIGVDISPEMLEAARSGLTQGGPGNVMFMGGRAEQLPVESGWADLVISNGALNLSTCKDSAFAEVARVLRPGGVFQAADLLLIAELPDELRDDHFAWSS